MTDADLIAKKLAFIETCVVQLQTLARPDQLASDIREERFVEHTLQLAIQAALDVASHIVSEGRLGEPRTNGELFDLLCGAGWIEEGQRGVLRKMAGFRNLVVHGYMTVDLAILRSIVENNLEDLLAFAGAIRSRLPAP